MSTRNLIVISDLHCGCRLGLCPPEGVQLDDGGRYSPSEFQCRMWALWQEFWRSWVPMVTRGEPYSVVLNGDAVDGVHHGSVTQVSHNLVDQGEIAYRVLAPVVATAEEYWHIRGTEAHVGKSGQEEERLAKRLGAKPNDSGQHARWELWKHVGDALVHILHHIGTTSSSAYESTAVYKELVEAYVEAGRWGDRPPDVIVRSHRHRYFQTKVPAKNGSAFAVVTPAWQGKTPFTFKLAGARQSQPQFGGICIRQGDEEYFVREMVWKLERPSAE